MLEDNGVEFEKNNEMGLLLRGFLFLNLGCQLEAKREIFEMKASTCINQLKLRAESNCDFMRIKQSSTCNWFLPFL